MSKVIFSFLIVGGLGFTSWLYMDDIYSMFEEYSGSSLESVDNSEVDVGDFNGLLESGSQVSVVDSVNSAPQFDSVHSAAVSSVGENISTSVASAAVSSVSENVSAGSPVVKRKRDSLVGNREKTVDNRNITSSVEVTDAERYGRLINKYQDMTAVNKAKINESASDLSKRIANLKIELFNSNPELFVEEYSSLIDKRESLKKDATAESLKRLNDRMSLINASIKLTKTIEKASLKDKYTIDKSRKEALVDEDRKSQLEGRSSLDKYVLNGGVGVYIPISSSTDKVVMNDVIKDASKDDLSRDKKIKDKLLSDRVMLEALVDEFGYIDLSMMPSGVVDSNLKDYCVVRTSINRISSKAVLKKSDYKVTLRVGSSVEGYSVSEITPEYIVFNPNKNIIKNYKVRMGVSFYSCRGR